MAALVFGVLVSLALIVVLNNLDKQPVKGWITGAIRDATGMLVDFDELTVEPSGRLFVRGLSIGSPPPFDEVEPVLLAVGSLDADVELGALIDGDLVVPRLVVDGVQVTIVEGAAGTSLDALLEGLGPPSEEEPVPPSQALALPRMEGRIELLALDVRGISFEQVAESGEQSTIEGIRVSGDVRLRRGGAQGRVVVEGEADGDGVRLVRGGAGAGEAVLDLSAELTLRGPDEASIEVAASVRSQSLWPEPLPDGPLLTLGADALFLPEQGRISLNLKDFSAFGGAVEGSLRGDLVETADGLRPVLRGGAARARVVDMAGLGLDGLLRGAVLRGVAVDLVASDMEVEPGTVGEQPARGAARITASAQVATMPTDGGQLALEGLELELEARARGPLALDLTGVARAAAVAVEGPRGVTRAEGARIEVDGRGLRFAEARADARGALSVVTAFERLTHRAGDVALDVGPVRLVTVGALDGGPPYRAAVEGPVEWLALADAEGGVLRVEGARLSARGEGLFASLLVAPVVLRAQVRARSVATVVSGAAAVLDDASAQLTARLTLHGLDLQADMPVGSLAVRSGELHAAATGGRASVQALRLNVPEGRPQDAKGRVTLRLGVAELTATTPELAATSAAIHAEASATLTGGAPYALAGEARFERLDATAKAAMPTLREGRIQCRIEDFRPAEQLAHATGELVVDARVRACGRGDGQCPGAMTMRATLARPAITEANTPTRPASAHDATARRSTATGAPTRPAGAHDAAARRSTATPAPGPVTVDLAVAAPSLGPWVTLMPPAMRRSLGWSRLAVEARARGALSGGALGEGPLQVEGTLDGRVRGLGFGVGGSSVDVPQLAMKGRLSGTTRAFDAHATLDLLGARFGELRTRGPMRVVADAGWSAAKPALRLALKTTGKGAPDLDALVDLSFDRKSRRLRYDARADVTDLDLLAPLLPRDVTLSGERATVKARGALTGVVRRFDGPMPVLEDELLAGVDGHHELSATVRGLRTGRGEARIDLPDGRLDMTATADRGEVDTRIDLRLDAAQVSSAAGTVDAGDVALQLFVQSRGEVRSGVLEARVQASVGALAQDLWPRAPLGDVRLFAEGRLERLDGLRIDRLELSNGASGSTLTATAALDGLALRTAIPRTLGLTEAGDVEPIPGRTSLTATGTLTQDMARLGGLVHGLTGTGTMRIPFMIESGDRSLYRVRATVEASGVNLSMADVELTGLNGQVAIEEEIDITGGGFDLIPGAGRNAYSQARFQDVHPFLDGDSFLTLERLTWRGHTLGPFAGNLRVRRNVIALDQLQLEHQGGSITGQLIAEYKQGASSVLFRGNVTGLRPTGSDEVLDANAALLFAPEKLELEGRVQIVRMGRGHLRAALDLLDPYGADPTMNTIRGALKLGYPEYVRLRLSHGFLSAKVELGGLADVIRLDEIRGIPTGPLLHRFVGPLLRADNF